jgi:hypothetical protein
MSRSRPAGSSATRVGSKIFEIRCNTGAKVEERVGDD